MTDSIGSTAQTRQIAEQLMAAYEEMKPREPVIHPLVKWLIGAIGAFGSAALIGLGFWLVSSVSSMRETLARIDERQVLNAQNITDRFQAIDTRLSRLETLKEDRK